MIVQVNDHYFELIDNYRDALNQEQFEARYSEVLDKYPVIVGDIGYEQLRLKGFYEDRNKKADIARRFSSIQDYLLEYCNFGCPYFVLRRLTAHEVVRKEADDVEFEDLSTISKGEIERNSKAAIERVNHEQEASYNKDEKTLKHFLK